MARLRLEWMSLVCLLTGTVVNLTLSYNTTGGLVCHCTSECDSNLECLGSSGCTSGWSGTTCQRYNQALGKDTRQSSTINDCVWADNADKIDACGLKNSSLAVDGKRSTNYWSGTCTMTDVNQKQAWWSVNLGQIHQIYYIKIYSPITNKQRIKGFTVSVDGDLCYTSPPYNTPVPPISIHCTRPMIGSNITIRAHQEQFILNLCEVEVYECADGVFGERCSSLCNCKNPDEVCDKLTGQCQSGCVDGYIGDGCQTKCVDGKFGAGCNSSCNCMYSEVCNKKTGHCNSGCSAGFTGTGCQEPCPNGHYGFNCSEVCGHCRGGGTYCNHVDGKCTYRCESNWTGDQCKECEDRKFGVRCSYSCKCKNPDEVCNKTTGHCSSGCSDGYTGNGCQTRCQRGFYGSRCSKKCGHCAGWEINCDHVNGTCKNGCRGNWDGGQCKVCKNFWFGEECSTKCTCKNYNEVCNKRTGECAKSGCQDRRTGLDCQTHCVYYRFGPNCTKTCKCRNPTEVCDKTTGQCAATGCREGWRGRNCLTHCGDGTYGYNCSGTCGRCVDGEVCNKTDGTCFAGCEPGFLEPFCQDCRDGYYGAECRRCGQCLNNSPCDKQTGQCAEGCQPGLEGDNCHEACKEGTYGHACSGTCGRCLKKEVCDKQGGACPDGCEEGFVEPLCQACRERHYGSDCRRCGQCLANSPCNKLTGQCPGECQHGWKGKKCHEAETAKSGTIKVFGFVESKAPVTVNGNPALTRDGNTSLVSCVTVTGTQPSWKITFDNKHTIYGVGIYMRIVDNSSQINVHVDGSFCHYGFLYEEKEVQHFTPCPEPIEGKSVTIYLQNRKKKINLTLCEVTVFVSDEENIPIFSITLSIVGLTIMMVIGVIIFIAMRRRSQRTKAAIEDKNEAKYIIATYQPGDSSNEQLEESEGHNYEVLPMDGHVYEEPINT